MGAWSYVRGRILDGEAAGLAARELDYIGRPAAAAPATGSQRAYLGEQKVLVRKILAREGDPRTM